MGLLVTALLTLSLSGAVASRDPGPPGATNTTRMVVITVDDLPATPRTAALSDVEHINTALLAALSAHGVRAVGLVTTSHTDPPSQRQKRIELLRRWAEAGLELGNHSYSHRAFHELSLEAYVEDVTRGEALPRQLMSDRDAALFYFRHPFNSAGGDSAKRAAFDRIMAARGVTIAPFTVENADYVYNWLRLDALAAGDEGLVSRLEDAYLAHTFRVFDFFQRLTQETFGRAIPQVLLIHANALNASALDRLLTGLKERGYRFVSLAEAMADEAYATPDPYHERWGYSWLHRWRRGLGLEDRLRDEPDPQEWVRDAYRRRQ